MIIRQATKEDLMQIAKLHITCFPESFSSQIGEGLLSRFYEEYLNSIPELFLVAEEDERLIGLCMGYYCEDNQYMKRFIKHNFIRLSLRCLLLVLKLNKLMFLKIGHVIFKKKEQILSKREKSDYPLNERGDLLSICVLDEVKGKGVSSALMNTYENILCKNGRKVCQLTAASDNGRANRFYEKHGYSKYLESDIRACYEKVLV